MRKTLLTILAAIAINSTAQTADERIGSLINQSKWFELKKELPKSGNDIKTGFLKLLSEIMVNNHFNRPAEAVAGIDSLLTFHQSDIGSSNALNLAILSAVIEMEQGNYKEAAGRIEKTVAALKQQNAPEEAIEALTKRFSYYSNLKDIPQPSVSNHANDMEADIRIEDVVLPESIDKKGKRGTTIIIPVIINDKQHDMIFDTGASTFMSERFAHETGVTVVGDSLRISNGNSNYDMFGKTGTIDKIEIGGMTYHNPLITIAPPNALDSVMQIDALIGMDFIRRFDEIRIYPKKKKIVFAARATAKLPEDGSNLMIENNRLRLKTKCGEEELIFVLDTGCSTFALSSKYYEKHKTEIDTKGKRIKQIGGGFNMIKEREIAILPEFATEIAGKKAVFKNASVNIHSDGAMDAYDGIMGMNLINQFDCVTINLKDMVMEVE